jgi:hypothetical protein
MQKQMMAGLLAAFLFALVPAANAVPIISHRVYGPSPWLPLEQFGKWLHANLENKPFYVSTAEGRLRHGVSEWRVRWTPAPRNAEWYWYWWFGSTGPQYEVHAAPLVGRNGFDQIWLQSFVDAQGVRKYQSIYLKIIWPKGMTPPPTSYESPRATALEPALTPAPATPPPASVPMTPAPVPTQPEID